MKQNIIEFSWFMVCTVPMKQPYLLPRKISLSSFTLENNLKKKDFNNTFLMFRMIPGIGIRSV